MNDTLRMWKRVRERMLISVFERLWRAIESTHRQFQLILLKRGHKLSARGSSTLVSQLWELKQCNCSLVVHLWWFSGFIRRERKKGWNTEYRGTEHCAEKKKKRQIEIKWAESCRMVGNVGCIQVSLWRAQNKCKDRWKRQRFHCVSPEAVS